MNDYRKKMKKYNSKIDAFIELAEATKELYDLTKNRKGLYKMLNRFALQVNQAACELGIKYIRKQEHLTIEEIKKIKKAL